MVMKKKKLGVSLFRQNIALTDQNTSVTVLTECHMLIADWTQCMTITRKLHITISNKTRLRSGWGHKT